MRSLQYYYNGLLENYSNRIFLRIEQFSFSRQCASGLNPAVREASTYTGSGKAAVELAFDFPIVYLKFNSNLALV
ncbi:hypothetical protein FXO37_34579 [Capsicum annuum]|nr:hypothetical protein FXO37_34579 [Capsicum annuum]